ncbi:MAG: hypothetical protein ACJATA_001959 [Sphingobacteriales bacterium]|jgi:hypothetical protein
MSQTKSQYSLSFNDSIHKVYVDTDWAAIEIRKTTVKEAEFYMWNFKTDHLKQLSPVDLISWQTTLVGLKDGVALLSYFPNESIPGTDWLLAFDGLTGVMLWQNFQCRFKGLTQHGLSIKNIKNLNEGAQEIDLVTGKNIANSNNLLIFSNHEGALFPEIAHDKLDALSCQFPFLIKEKSPMEFIKSDNLTIIGAYSIENSTTNHWLLLFLGDQLEEQILLASKIKGYGFDPFFIFENKLIFIEEKSRLIIKKLN